MRVMTQVPLALSLSKGRFFFKREGLGFEKLSPNGVCNA
jgi:hypothetical protein